MHRRSRLAALAVAVASLAGGADPARAQNSEVVTLLQDLVRINTSNPPGNEALVAELLRTRLEPLGFEVEIVPTPTPGKAHLIARLPATAPDGRSRCCSPGTRTSSASSATLWTVDPFAGVVRGGRIFGRGAMDFKGGLAAFTVAAMRLARAGHAAQARPDPARRGRRGGRRLRHRRGSPRTTGPRSTPASRSTRAAGSSRTAGGRRADGHHDDRQELAVGDVPARAAPRRTRRGRCPTARCAGSSRALDRIERYEQPRRGSRPTARSYLRAWARGFERPQTARRLRAIARRAQPRGRAAGWPPARARQLRRAVQRAAAQDLRADDRRRRLPRQRAARHAPRRRSTCACCPATKPRPADPRARAA